MGERLPEAKTPMRVEDTLETYNACPGGGEQAQYEGTISFTEDDYRGITTLHHGLLVVSPTIKWKDGGHSRLAWMLVDTGALVSVLYWDTFFNLRLKESDLTPANNHIRGFGQREVPGTISLEISFRGGKQEVTRAIKFTVVRMMSGSNAILERMTLHALQAFTSSYHQSMKFPTKVGICTVKGSQH